MAPSGYTLTGFVTGFFYFSSSLYSGVIINSTSSVYLVYIVLYIAALVIQFSNLLE